MSVTAISGARAMDKRFYGIVSGIVTDVEDKTGKQGRVRVQFPWFDNQMETEWCRVQQSYAGNGYGSFFIPEKGDEVLIAFIQGDMRAPVILGGLYNGKDLPPSYRSSQQDQKMIRTKGKHELLFDDSSGSERIQVKSSKGHTIDLNDAQKKITVKSSGGQTVEIDDSAKTITISTNGKSVTVNGTSGEIKLSGMTVICDGTSVKLGGQAATQSLILGELFMALFNAHVHPCTAPGVPSLPPVTLMTPAMLSKISKTS
jgi:phage baseplate assembly protein V